MKKCNISKAEEDTFGYGVGECGEASAGVYQVVRQSNRGTAATLRSGHGLLSRTRLCADCANSLLEHDDDDFSFSFFEEDEG